MLDPDLAAAVIRGNAGDAVITILFLPDVAGIARVLQINSEFHFADFDLLQPVQLILPRWISVIRQVMPQQDLYRVICTV